MTKLIKAQHNIYVFSLNTVRFNKGKKKKHIFHNQMQPLWGNTLCLAGAV